MSSETYLYQSMSDNMAGKWLPTLLVYFIWTILTTIFTLGCSMIHPVASYISAFIAGGFLLYTFSTLPLANVRQPNAHVLEHAFEAFTDTKRIIIMSLLFALIVFAAALLCTFFIFGATVLFAGAAGNSIVSLFLFISIVGVGIPTTFMLSIYYKYCLTPNYLYDDSNLSVLEAFKTSKNAMNGYKLTLFKNHVPIYLVWILLYILLHVGIFTSLGGAQGMVDTYEMLERHEEQQKIAEAAQAQADLETANAYLKAQKASPKEHIPAYDPNTMTKDEYIRLLNSYGQRETVQDSKKDLAVLDQFIKATDNISKQAIAPTHHDDELMANLKLAILCVILFCIFMFFTLPLYWAIQNELYLMLADMNDTKKDAIERVTRMQQGRLPEPTPSEPTPPSNAPRPTEPRPQTPPEPVAPAPKRELGAGLNFDFGAPCAPEPSSARSSNSALRRAPSNEDRELEELSNLPIQGASLDSMEINPLDFGADIERALEDDNNNQTVQFGKRHMMPSDEEARTMFNSGTITKVPLINKTRPVSEDALTSIPQETELFFNFGNRDFQDR